MYVELLLYLTVQLSLSLFLLLSHKIEQETFDSRPRVFIRAYHSVQYLTSIQHMTILKIQLKVPTSLDPHVRHLISHKHALHLSLDSRPNVHHTSGRIGKDTPFLVFQRTRESILLREPLRVSDVVRSKRNILRRQGNTSVQRNLLRIFQIQESAFRKRHSPFDFDSQFPRHWSGIPCGLSRSGCRHLELLLWSLPHSSDRLDQLCRRQNKHRTKSCNQDGRPRPHQLDIVGELGPFGVFGRIFKEQLCITDRAVYEEESDRIRSDGECGMAGCNVKEDYILTRKFGREPICCREEWIWDVGVC